MRKKYGVLILGLILCGIGLSAWIYQIISGLAITDLSNSFSWGLYMGSFEFFIGMSSGGMLVFSIAYIWGVKSLTPFVKIGTITSLATVVASGIAILTDLGQPSRVLYMLLTPNFASPLFWDVIVLGIYVVVCFIAVLLQFLPDTKKFGEKEGFKAACEIHSKRLAYFTLPFIAVLNAVTTLMFAVQNAREWWNSALLPADSVAVATAVGISFMLLIGALLLGKEGYKFWSEGFTLLTKIAGVALLVHLCFTALELVVIGWNNTLEGKHLLGLLANDYGWLYGIEIILPLIAMVVYIGVKDGKRSWIMTMSIFVIVAIFIHRMMLLLPAFNSIPLSIPVAGLQSESWSVPIASGMLREGQDIFVTYWNYTPTLLEWCVTLLPIGIILVLVTGAVCLFPELPGEKKAYR